MCHGQSPVAGTLPPAGAPGVWDCGQLLFQLLAVLRVLAWQAREQYPNPKFGHHHLLKDFSGVLHLHLLSQEGNSSSRTQDTALPQEQHIQLDPGLLFEL